MSSESFTQLPHRLSEAEMKQEESVGVERWAKNGREKLEGIEMPERLKSLVRASLDTPQLGSYHNEGPEMAAHLGLIMETVDAINSDTFDFHVLGLPERLEEKVKEKITKVIKEHYEQMKTYAYLHDLEKMSCMNIENTDGEQRVFTMKEWHELVAQNNGDKEKAMATLVEQGYVKIGYRVGGELAKELGIAEKDHGDEGERVLLEMADRDAEVKEFISGLGLILKGVANHEMHFQVFNNAKSAGKYEKFLANIFTEAEIDFIYAACLIDIAGSLDKNGKSNFQGFRNMVIARESHDLIKGSGLTNVESLVNLDSIEKVQNRIEQLRKDAVVKEMILEKTDVELLGQQTDVWGTMSVEDRDELYKALNETIGRDDPVALLGQMLPNRLKRYIKNVRAYLESKV
jgi:hypothetical protein